MGLKTKLINSTLKIVDDNNNEFLIPKTDIRFKFSHDETTVILTDVKLNNAYSSLISELEDVDTGLIGTKEDVELYLAARSGFNPAMGGSMAYKELILNLSFIEIESELIPVVTGVENSINGLTPVFTNSESGVFELDNFTFDVETAKCFVGNISNPDYFFQTVAFISEANNKLLVKVWRNDSGDDWSGYTLTFSNLPIHVIVPN